MKKIILAALVTLGVGLFMPLSAMAAPAGSSIIAGTITRGGSPVQGANVVVTCDSNSLNSTTTVAGGYFVQFTSTQCPSGTTAFVTATKGGQSASNSGTVNNLTTTPTVINLALVNVSIVPEFGLITGAAALVVGGAAFLVVRRQKLASHKN